MLTYIVHGSCLLSCFLNCYWQLQHPLALFSKPAVAFAHCTELVGMCCCDLRRSIAADVVDTIAATGGNALKLVHTHDGAAAAAMALAYGTPKDRKRLVKGMKGEAQ